MNKLDANVNALGLQKNTDRYSRSFGVVCPH